MNRIGSLDQVNPNAAKSPSEAQHNIPSIGNANGSLVIHQEGDSIQYAGSVEHVPEVDEEKSHEDPNSAYHPGVFQGLSLRLYGQETDMFQNECNSEPDLYYEQYMNELVPDEEIQHRRAKSFIDFSSESETRLSMMYGLNDNIAEQQEQEDEQTDTKSKTKREVNKRLMNKSEGPMTIKGIINNVKMMEADQKFQRAPRAYPSTVVKRLSQGLLALKPADLKGSKTGGEFNINAVGNEYIKNIPFGHSKKGISGQLKEIQESICDFGKIGRRMKAAKKLPQ